MAITTFTSGQVLTAAQMNAVQGNDYNQTVSTKTASYTLVAADKGTRVVMNSASSTTITVNTSLFAAGDTLVLQNIGAGVCTVTAGTATVSSAGPLAIPQYGSGTLYFTSAGAAIYFPSAVTAATVSSGLVVVKAETAFSAVSSFTADNVFTSSYTNYLILIKFANTSDASLNLQFRAATTTTTTNYNYNGYQMTSTAAQSYGYNVSQSSLKLAQTGGSSVIGYCQANIYSPQIAEQTGLIATNLRFDASYAAPVAQGTTGNQNSSTQFDGFIVSTSAGTTTGSYTVYGYAKTV